MNCPRQTPNSMATLLQQQNCIKTLTTNNGVVANSGNGGATGGVASTSSASGQLTTSRVLLPHEMVTIPPAGDSANLQTNHNQSFQYQQHQQYRFYNSNSNDSSIASSMFRPLTALHPHQQHLSQSNHNHHQPFNSIQQNNIPKPSLGATMYSQHQPVVTPAATTNANSVNNRTECAIGGNGGADGDSLRNNGTENHCDFDESSNHVGTTTSNAGDVEQEVDQTEEEPEPEIDIVINNVVCSFSVRCHLNLREIALNGRNVEFRRENGMVTMKLRRPYTTASIWSSGRITCTGATSEDQAKVGARRYARCLQSLGFPVKFNSFRVVNVLGTCSMPWAIKIVNFSERYKQDASYEPELHPGVTYKLKTPKATLKIFSTGSITVTASSVANVQSAIEHIFPLVYEFRKKRIVPDAPAIEKNLMKEVPVDFDESDQFESANKPKRKKYPFGLENDPQDDIMCVSDMEEDGERERD